MSAHIKNIKYFYSASSFITERTINNSEAYSETKKVTSAPSSLPSFGTPGAGQAPGNKGTEGGKFRQPNGDRGRAGARLPDLIAGPSCAAAVRLCPHCGLYTAQGTELYGGLPGGLREGRNTVRGLRTWKGSLGRKDEIYSVFIKET